MNQCITSSAIKLSVVLSLFGVFSQAQTAKLNQTIGSETTIFEEKNGIVAVEAEYFYKQSKSDIRQWYRTSKNELSKVGRDEDGAHYNGASNKAYIEILPDERVTHSDKIEQGKNFTDEAGTMAVVHYKVKINTPGRYYVWARAFSTGSEDNGVHVGLNGEWPENGRRMQWCEDKNKWTWASKQRTKEVHCGVPKEIYLDIKKSGIQDIQFSMREDGFELDKFILTTNPDYVPLEEGPQILLVKGTLQDAFPKKDATVTPKSYFMRIATSSGTNKAIAAQEFPVNGTHFYKNGKNWLAINPNEHQEATTSTIFNFESGTYDVVFVGVGENDGQSTFTVLINDQEIGSYQPPLSQSMFEEGKNSNALWENRTLKKGDTITVVAKIGSADGKEFTRGRWAGIVFAPVGKGKTIQEAPSSFSQF